MIPKNNLIGNVYGRLTVTSFSHKDKRGRVHWACICECGNINSVRVDALTRGVSKSCGCLQKALLADRKLSHGYTVNGNNNGNKTYVSWKTMKQRCLNPNHGEYKNYGGRGITVCPRWVDSFANFVSDMGERTDGLTIDRINVNGNYEPDNCRWADWFVQNNNQRKHLIETTAIDHLSAEVR